jgi:sugar fermentation stimulation protein A
LGYRRCQELGLILFDRDKNDPLHCRFSRSLVAGYFLERPNRFVAYVDVKGERVKTHVPDPGRLKELLLPGTPVYLEDFGQDPSRKTRYSLLLVASPDGSTWVSLNTMLPNRVVRLLLAEGLLPHLVGYSLVKSEFTWGKSRFDFLLACRETGKQRLQEVKSVTLVLDDKTALFPDAPTVRGSRHLRELAEAARQGDYDAGVLFVVQRGDVRRVCPNQQTDPDFCMAVAEALETGVDFSAISYDLTPEGIRIHPEILPFELHDNPLHVTS